MPRSIYCYSCKAVKENAKEGYCRRCKNEKERARMLKSGKTLRHQTGKCRCGNERAPYSNCYCTECASNWRKKYFIRNPEKKIIQDKAEEKRKNSSKHTFKILARQFLYNAIRRKAISKSPCEICGKIKVQAHHDDYTKPLEVRWLCSIHHGEHHRKVKQQNSI